MAGRRGSCSKPLARALKKSDRGGTCSATSATRAEPGSGAGLGEVGQQQSSEGSKQMKHLNPVPWSWGSWEGLSRVGDSAWRERSKATRKVEGGD